jgi:hypothetical protein
MTTRLAQVVAGDLQVYAARPVKERAHAVGHDLRHPGEHDRHNQHLERLILEQRVNLRQRWLLVSGKLRGDRRRLRHGGGHRVAIVPGELEPVEPLAHVAFGHLRAQAGQSHERRARLGERPLHLPVRRL